MVLWFYGSVILWFYDSMILWFYYQSLRKETEIFSWYFPSSCHLDVCQLSFLLFCAFIYVPLSPLKLSRFFLVLMFSFSSTRNIESSLWNCRVLHNFMSLYQIKYIHTNNFKSNKFSIYEIAEFLVSVVSFTVFTSRNLRAENKISFEGKPSVPAYLF